MAGEPARQQQRRRFFLVANPIAGRTRNRLTDQTVHALTRQGCQVSALPEGTAPAQIDWPRARAEFDAVIAAGGDGTVRALASAMRDNSLPIGVIPRGTGNVLAEEMALPRTARRLAEVLMTGPDVQVRGARINGEPFYLMAGIGFDGHVVSLLDLGTKRRLGKPAYTGPVIQALRQPDPHLVCEVDGVSHEAGWVLVTNARCYGGAFCLTSRAGLEKDGLVAILFDRSGPLRRVSQLLALSAGQLHRTPGVRLMEAHRVVVRSREPVAVEADGDAFGKTPVTITWGGPALRLIVPDAYARTFSLATDAPA